jgi:hypothetical protein
MRTVVPIDELIAERDEWGRRMALAAERWVNAKAAGVDTRELDEEQARCEREWRALDRRIRRRKQR